MIANDTLSTRGYLAGYAAKGFTAAKMRVVGRDGFSISNWQARMSERYPILIINHRFASLTREATVMMIKTATCLGFLVACLATIATTPTMARQTVVVKHPPIVNQGDVSSSWSARQNVIDSKQYERLLATNPAFRQARMRKECGPITDPELRQSCLASFNQSEPYVGSSTAPRHHPSNAGR
jgi:hypothetical protein